MSFSLRKALIIAQPTCLLLTGVHVDVLYAEAGRHNDEYIYRIVGAKVRWERRAPIQERATRALGGETMRGLGRGVPVFLTPEGGPKAKTGRQGYLRTLWRPSEGTNLTHVGNGVGPTFFGGKSKTMCRVRFIFVLMT